jgi:flagella basal body P-ring formation protein FlgA
MLALLLSPDQLLPAMHKALGAGAIQIEIVEVSHYPAPEGEIVFSRQDLASPASPHAPARWRGSVISESGHRFSIWADVRLTTSCRRIVAAEPLPPDVPIRAVQLREETYAGFPSGTCGGHMEDMLGLVPLRAISAATALSRDLLAPPAAVHRGQEATAEYRSGGVHLSLTVIAERNGRIGELIPVLNPSSHKIFQARVAGIGTVAVEQ